MARKGNFADGEGGSFCEGKGDPSPPIEPKSCKVRSEAIFSSKGPGNHCWLAGAAERRDRLRRTKSLCETNMPLFLPAFPVSSSAKGKTVRSRLDDLLNIVRRRFPARTLRQRIFAPRSLGIAGVSARHRRRSRSSRCSSIETLEPRLAFDISVFAEDGLGQASLVVSNGDDLYMTHVATQPSSLIYGTSSSYQGDASQTGVIGSFEAIDRLQVVEGVAINEASIKADGLPAWGTDGFSNSSYFQPDYVPHTGTRFAGDGPLQGWEYGRTAGGTVGTETRGELSIRQPDGTTSVWTFTNWNQETNPPQFNNSEFFFVEGPKYGGQYELFGVGIKPPATSIPPGYYYPVSMTQEYDGTAGQTSSAGFRVTWNQPLAANANPRLTLEQYTSESGLVISSESVVPASYSPAFLTSSGGVTSDLRVDFTLSQAGGQGLVPGAFTAKAKILPFGSLGQVTFAGTDTPTDPTRVLGTGFYNLKFLGPTGYQDTYTFNPQYVGQQGALVGNNLTGSPGALTVEGFYNVETGVITLLFSGPGKPGRVDLADVRYAVYEQSEAGGQVSSVYVEPGLDVDAETTFELRSPGAAVYVNSPINTGSGDFTAVASQVYLNAEVNASSGNVHIGSTTIAAAARQESQQPTGVTLANFRDPAAVLTVNNGNLKDFVSVVGQEGSGYVSSPKVVVARAREARAEISPGSLIGGVARVQGYVAGRGYTQYNGDVNLNISAPELAGWDRDNDGVIDFPAEQAVVTATFSNGSITKVEVKNPGFGYTKPPTLTIPAPEQPASKTFTPQQAVVNLTYGGVLTTLSVDNPGFNYVPQQNEGFYDPDVDTYYDADFQPIAPPPDGRAKVTLKAYSSASLTGRTDQFTTFPLVGDGRYIARAALPPDGLAGPGVQLVARDDDGDGELDGTDVIGQYVYLADLDPNGEINPWFTIEVDAPPPIQAGETQRPYVTADLGLSEDGVQFDRIASFNVDPDNNGEGYGVVPTYYIEQPGERSDAGSLEVVVDGGSVADVRPLAPPLVFDIARGERSFKLVGDSQPSVDVSPSVDGSERVGAGLLPGTKRMDDGTYDPGTATNVDAIDMSIPFVFESRGYEPDQVFTGGESIAERLKKDFAKDNLDTTGDYEPVATGLPEGTVITVSREPRLLLVGADESGVSDGPGVRAEKIFLSLTTDDMADYASFFDGDLMGIADVPWSKLLELKDTQESRAQLEELRKRFNLADPTYGNQYRLVLETAITVQETAPDGQQIGEAGSTFTKEWKRYDWIGKAYLAAGRGYSEPPAVTVERASASTAGAEFHAELDESGRIIRFSETSRGGGYTDTTAGAYQAVVAGRDLVAPTEVLEFNSSVSATNYDLRVADDTRTQDRKAGELFVSPLFAIANGLNPADRVYIEADVANVVVAGEVSAVEQSYVIQSPVYRQLDGPFQLTTRNGVTGVGSGVLSGEVLTLAFGSESEEFRRDGSILTHRVDIDTNLAVADPTNTGNDAGSIRLTAGKAAADIFPVDITVRDQGSLKVSSSIRSSGTVSVQALQSLRVDAAIETAGDLSLQSVSAVGRVELFGPLTSTTGSISVQGGSVDVRADIESKSKREADGVTLVATAGDIALEGEIAVTDAGFVRMEQSSAEQAGAGVYKAFNIQTDPQTKQDTKVYDNLGYSVSWRATARVPIVVDSDPGIYERINVSLDIDHTYVGDLTGTLVAPSGERWTLFSRNGGSSDNYRNVTFDALSTRNITTSPSPFSGTYQPRSIVTRPVINEGTWYLEVYDGYFYDDGTVNSASLNFVGSTSAADDNASSFGAVSGVGLVRGGDVVVVADGDVGILGRGLDGLLLIDSPAIEVHSNAGSVGLNASRAAQFSVSTPNDVVLATSATDIVGRNGRLEPALQAEIRRAASVTLDAPRGSIRGTVEGSDAVLLSGFDNGEPLAAAGSVDIRIVDADVAVSDLPVGGTGVVDVGRALPFSSLGVSGVQGDTQGQLAGVIRGSGLLGEIIDGVTIGDRLLVLGDEQQSYQEAVSLAVGLSVGQVGSSLTVDDSIVTDPAGGSFTVTTDAAGDIIGVDQFPGWLPIMAGEFAGVRELVWGREAGEAGKYNAVVVWELGLDAQWTGKEEVFTTNDVGFYASEKRYSKDLNKDGTVGNRVVESDGSVALELNMADQPVVNGKVIQAAGSAVYSTGEWQVKAAEAVAGQNVLAWQNTAGGDGRYVLWACSGNWEREGGISLPPPGSLEFAEYENALRLDLNGDGVLGTLQGGGIRGDKAAIAEDGRVFVDGKALTKDGVPVSADQFAGWQVLSVVEQETGGGASVLWGHRSGRVAVWEFDENGEFQSQGVVPSPENTDAFTAFEGRFHVDLGQSGFWSLLANQSLTVAQPNVYKSYSASKAAGVYEVQAVGGLASEWVLVRATDFNSEEELADRLRIRDASTNKFYQLERLAGAVGSNETDQPTRAYEVPAATTNIAVSSGNQLTYVITDNGGDNSTAGSIGRVINLINETTSVSQAVELAFDASVGLITPLQELPKLSRPVIVDGYKRWIVEDGRGGAVDVSWVTDANGLPVATAVADGRQLDGLLPVALSGAGIVQDRDGALLNEYFQNVVDGLVLSDIDGRDSGNVFYAGISGVKNFEIGSFETGAALRVERSSNVVLDNVVIGSGGPTSLLGSQVGLEVTGGRQVTLKNSSLVGNRVGLWVEDDGDGLYGEFIQQVSDDIHVVSSDFLENVVGARLGGTGTVVFGATPIYTEVPVELVRGTTAISVADSDVYSELWDKLYLGMAVSGQGLTEGSEVIGFDRRAGKIAISKPVESSTPPYENTTLRFGGGWGVNSPRSVAATASLNAGSNRIQMPLTQQIISAAEYGVPVVGEGVASGTFVLAIDVDRQEVVLSRPLVGSTLPGAVATIAFVTGQGNRNFVEDSRVGIELVGGAHEIVQTTVRRSEVGILAEGVREPAGEHKIGFQTARSAGFANIIEASSAFGILVSDDLLYGVSPRVRIDGNVFQSLGAEDNARGNIGRRSFVGGVLSEDVLGILGGKSYLPSASGLDDFGNLHNTFLPGPGANTLAPPVIEPLSAVIRTATPTIRGTAYDGAEIRLFANGELIGETTAAIDGSWVVVVASADELENGSYALTATATDAQGVTSAPSAEVVITVEVDEVPPPIDQIGLSTVSITSQQPTLEGVSEPGTFVEMTLNGAVFETTTDSLGRWQVNTATTVPILGILNSFVHGNSYAVTLYATDLAGNRTGPIFGTVLYDNPPPPPGNPEPPRRPTADF